MKAVILAAGLGTRLRPLSDRLPKPLFPILNRPLLAILLEQLQEAGFNHVGINSHHQATELQAYVRHHLPGGLQTHLSYEPEILGTGGGLKKMADFLGDQPFVVLNADILTDVDVAAVYAAHAEGALATLVLHHCPRFNTVWRDAEGAIAGFGDPRPPAAVGRPLAFTGLQVVSPWLLEQMPPGIFVDIIDTYRQVIAAGKKIAAYVVQDHFWEDIGTPEAYREVHQQLLAGQIPGLAHLFPPLTDPWMGHHVSLGTGVCFAGGISVGPGARIGAGVSLKNTVIWARATIDPEISLTDCIVGQGVRVRRSARDACLV